MKSNLHLFRSAMFCFLLFISQSIKAQTFSTFATVGNNPSAIAIDGTGNVWVTNSSDNTVTKLSSSGGTIGTFPVGTFPGSIAINPSGNCWVANINDATITELGPSGTTIGTYNVGTDPVGVAIDGSGNIWINNGGDGSVTELSPTGVTLGTYTFSFGGGGYGGGITVSSTGSIWLTDAVQSVIKLNSSGVILGRYTVGNNPLGIAIDASGNVWAANNLDNTVTKLSSSGALIGTYSVGSSPTGIVVDGLGNVWVTNSGDNTVTKLSSSGITAGTYSVGTSPTGIAINTAGAIFVANNGGNTVSKQAAVVLPITLSNFSGIKETTDNLLQWTVSNPIGFSEFGLQREDNNGFSTIATIPYQNQIRNYNYKDFAINGNETYRLVLIDLDGKTIYSPIVFIPRSSENVFSINNIYPIPAINYLNISVYAPVQTSVKYTVYDMNGKLMMQIENQADGAVTQTLDVSRIAKGTYTLNISGASGMVKTQKFTKL